MNGWMNEWMNEWKGEKINKWMNGWMNGRMDKGWMNACLPYPDLSNEFFVKLCLCIVHWMGNQPEH